MRRRFTFCPVGPPLISGDSDPAGGRVDGGSVTAAPRPLPPARGLSCDCEASDRWELMNWWLFPRLGVAVNRIARAGGTVSPGARGGAEENAARASGHSDR